MESALLALAQAALLLALAPLWAGVVDALEARLRMRRGRPLLQRYRDLAKLIHKETVLAAEASSLARFAPYAMLGAAAAVCAWMPVLSTRPALGFAGDLVTTVALLAAMRVLLALLALEAGTPLAGMTTGRHLALSALAEPALLLALLARSVAAGSTDLASIAAYVAATPGAWAAPAHLLALAAVTIAVAAETGLGPVDGRDAPDALGAIHETRALDASGRHLALVEWAGAMRRLVLLTLVASLFLPWGLAATLAPDALALALAAWLGKLLLFAIVVAVAQSVTATRRLARVPELPGMAFLLALLALTSSSLAR